MKIYFAGPDVFRPDYVEWRRYVEALCRNHGWQPLIPGDVEAGEQSAPQLREFNLSLVQGADAVLANLNPFRGLEPDSGTVFEAAYAFGNGKVVIGYIERPIALLQRVQQQYGPVSQRRDGFRWRDKDGWGVEDFGLPVNLMLTSFDLVSGGVANAIARLAERAALPAMAIAGT